MQAWFFIRFGVGSGESKRVSLFSRSIAALNLRSSLLPLGRVETSFTLLSLNRSLRQNRSELHSALAAPVFANWLCRNAASLG